MKNIIFFSLIFAICFNSAISNQIFLKKTLNNGLIGKETMLYNLKVLNNLIE
jgi:hypothetical protein